MLSGIRNLLPGLPQINGVGQELRCSYPCGVLPVLCLDMELPRRGLAIPWDSSDVQRFWDCALCSGSGMRFAALLEQVAKRAWELKYPLRTPAIRFSPREAGQPPRQTTQNHTLKHFLAPELARIAETCMQVLENKKHT